MSNTVTIEMTYEAVDTAVVDLSPKTWADVGDWYVKWSKLYVQFEGETAWHEYDMSDDSSPEIDYKRPLRTDVYEGEYAFDVTLDTQEGF
jgi:hypothetical protein